MSKNQSHRVGDYICKKKITTNKSICDLQHTQTHTNTLLKINWKRIAKPMDKSIRKLNKHFTKKDSLIVHRHLKACSNLPSSLENAN